MLVMGIAFWVFVIAVVFYLSRRLPGSVKTAPLTNVKKRVAFKVRYELNVRQPISEFEEKMRVGMSRERNEVWVTAFCSESEVLRVTANVGSRYKCHATDNVSNWPAVACQVGASQIRQYHSHPPDLFCSALSPQDRETDTRLKSFLKQNGLQYRSYLVYPNLFGFDYRIKPFHEE